MDTLRRRGCRLSRAGAARGVPRPRRASKRPFALRLGPLDRSLTASSSGWHSFGASAPAAQVYEHFGITVERVAELGRSVVARVEWSVTHAMSTSADTNVNPRLEALSQGRRQRLARPDQPRR